MNCSHCKVNKIDPFGSFLCGNEHIQCQQCNNIRQGHCGYCGDRTKFVQIKINSSGFSLPIKQAQDSIHLSPLISSLPNLSRESQIDCSENSFKEHEIQSRISGEKLSVKNFKESLHCNDEIKINNTVPEQNKSLIETSLIGSTPSKDLVSFVEKKFENGASKSGQALIPFVMSLKCQSNIFPKEHQLSCNFSKKMLNDIETQSQLSEEQLSMRDSKNSLNQNPIMGNDQKTSLNGNKNCIKTLFISTTTAENSVSSTETSFKNNTNVNEFSNADLRKSSCQSSKPSDDKKENVFTFEEDPNNSNTRQCFEIHVISSSNSLQNFYSNPKPDVLDTVLNTNNLGPQQQQEKKLSNKILPEFEASNSVNTRVKVENYLKNYNPSNFNSSNITPTYNCQHFHYNFSIPSGKETLKLTMKTVGASTESDPSLKSVCYEKPDTYLGANIKPQEYLVMPAVGVTSLLPQITEKIALDKFGRPTIDVRMQKILESLQEQTHIHPAQEKFNLNKIPQEVVVKQTQHQSKEEQSMASILQFINVYRAFYNPPNPPIKPVNNLHYLPQPEPVQQEPPANQFQAVISNALVHELLAKKPKFSTTKVMPAYMLTISRTPIQCPESTCQRIIFVSDFSKHLVVDHNQLPMERIAPFQCKNFFLDARLAHCGISRCHFLYFMCNKITDLGSSEYKDFLPILIMTTRISLSQMCGVSEHASNLQFLLIWVTGIAPEEFPIAVSLTVWARSGSTPSCHLNYSGEMYSIRKSQLALDIWQSGRMLLLSPREIEALTNHGKEMLNCQLTVH